MRVGRADQLPEDRLLLDDLRVVLDVGRPRHAVDQRRDVGRSADRVELARARQFLLQRDEVDRRPALGQRDDLVEDPAVRVAVEVLGAQHLHGEVVGVVLDQDGPEHRAFGLEVVRQRAFDNGSGSGIGHVKMLAGWMGMKGLPPGTADSVTGPGPGGQRSAETFARQQAAGSGQQAADHAVTP